METYAGQIRHKETGEAKTEHNAHDTKDCQNKTGSNMHTKSQTRTHRLDTKTGVSSLETHNRLGKIKDDREGEEHGDRHRDMTRSRP